MIEHLIHHETMLLHEKNWVIPRVAHSDTRKPELMYC